MASNFNDDEPVWDLVDFRSRGNEVSPFRGRVEDQLMRQFSRSRSGQGNTYNLHVGNTYNFYFDQASPQSNTARTLSGILNSNPDPFSYMSRSRDDDRPGRSSMSRMMDDCRSERSNSTSTRHESDVATSQNDDSKCKVCLDNTADCVFTCGHYVCDSCGQTLKSNDLPCHICRQPIQNIIKTYRS
uniref:Uncharacterized protein LOC111136285 n=1 Tax=Crassostrea virginica TaxID=6565 RepID=A0A8B8ES13_CRAVI|nr:uncharacterized protein LOC111136285 [Crassostrea virginica]